MDNAKVKFYKEKGAADMAYLRRQGKDMAPDIEIKFYPQSKFSVLDLEQKLASNMKIMSKFIYPFYKSLFQIIQFSYLDDIASLPEEMAEITVRKGVQEEDLTKKMEGLKIKLSAMCKENEELRDSVESRIVSLKHYLPFNSKEGMEMFFRVSLICYWWH